MSWPPKRGWRKALLEGREIPQHPGGKFKGKRRARPSSANAEEWRKVEEAAHAAAAAVARASDVSGLILH